MFPPPLQVPFIAFYRKEYVEPELNINDLWKVYNWDEKWMQLRSRKQGIIRLFEKMQQYQFDQIDPEQPLDSRVRPLVEADISKWVLYTVLVGSLHRIYMKITIYFLLSIKS